ncbi:TonB-dependent hemoglobin/transferrin/lactoferrin family receptor [Pseudoalteromonas fuliginea]|uniref:TonB-dependent hemoglobin/transferrin/lactoferrin family receptor n=1 Tax=Pseudoalteromonas fuliginea TaxID=1872678 RepID=A0AB73BGC0_9GAMM|nr:TonB-dependent hemoglobin/transferrin/lactoferrin family receptor [Pseudoalteromonas fuliginea]KAA1159826.1 TonB-dependent hemoglobin/transferrin/lactoferrin family receptor [Pseudoalteromonas fuliginea]
MKYKKSILTSAITIALSGQAFGQTIQTLEKTVVKSQSIERDAVVEVLSSEELALRQVDNFEDLVKLVPGVSVSKGDDRWGASGFNIRGLDEDRVAINVDGVPQGETLKYESGQAYGYFKGSRNGVDIEALKSVEIVKGADAILSGNGSLAGAVNMTTKDPDDFLSYQGDDSGFAIKAGYSGENSETMTSLTAANRTGALESLIIYTYRDGNEFENYDMNGADIEGSAREIPDPQDTKLNSVLAKLIYEISPDNEIGFVGTYYKTKVITGTQSFNGGWYSNRVGNDISKTTRVGVFHKYEGETALFDKITTALNKQSIDFAANTSQHARFGFGGGITTDEDRVDTRAFNQDLFQVTVDLEKSFKFAQQKHKLVYGAEILNKDYENSQVRKSNSILNDKGWVESSSQALIPKSEADIYTLYALDTFNLGKTTQARLGARYDHYTYNAKADENYSDESGTLGEISFSMATWTAGIEQALNDSFSIEMGVSTGFRAPTIEDMYTTSGTLDDWNEVPNADLKAEYSTNYDVALVGEFSKGSFRLGTFFSKYKDFIDSEKRQGINTNTGETDPDGFFVNFNSDTVEIKGIEFSADLNLSRTFDLTPGLKTRVQAAYTSGENSEDTPIYSIQPFNLTWGISYDQPEGNWGVHTYASYTAGKEDKDSFTIDENGEKTYPLYSSNAATIIDLTGYYNITESLRLVAGVYNVTDKEYYRWDSVRFVDQGDMRPGIGVTDNGIKRYSEAGRNLGVNVSYKF